MVVFSSIKLGATPELYALATVIVAVVAGLLLADIDSDGELDLVEFEGASSGLLGQEDYDEAGGALEPGASAAILLYENRWAVPFAAAMRASGAQLVSRGGITANDLVDAAEAIDTANA